MTVCLDIWGGECSQDHIARYMLPIDEAQLRYEMVPLTSP